MRPSERPLYASSTMFLNQYDPLKNQMVRILDEDGNHREELIPKELTPEVVQKLYEKMIFVRLVNERMLKLQRQGRMGTFASLRGQEACQIGSEYALEKTDWVVPAFREHAAMWAHGVPMETVMIYWRGTEEGGRIPAGVHVLPPSIPVGSQMLHAVGLSWASKMRGEKEVAITYFGDGATSEGDFHEAMNFAGVFKAGTVFLCQNNQYAISTTRAKQTASQTIAQKAIAYGFPGVLVDGNDLLAMYAVTKEAVERARKGEGPTLIEAYTYRLDDHTTSDDASKYRDKSEVESWLPRDPVVRLQKYLSKFKLWGQKYEDELREKYQGEIDRLVEKVESTPDPSLEDLFSFTYATRTPQEEEQLHYLKYIMEKKGGQHG